MNSRKLIFKLFEYKCDESALKMDVAGLMRSFKDEKRYDTSYFSNEVVSKFSYL
jgi:hypothetical protein